MVPLTQIAHELVRESVETGDLVIDATCGNGHDTVFLSELVGKSGKVFACDLQQAAIDATRKCCNEQSNIEYHLGDHALILQSFFEKHSSSVSAILFNLGYLPGGEKSQTTTPSTTIAAMQASLQLLKPGGILSVLAYVGHPGGREEATAVEEFLSNRIEKKEWEPLHWPDEGLSENSPRLYGVCRNHLLD